MKTLPLLFSLLFAVLLLGSCAENSSSLVIVQNQSPSSGCEASNAAEDSFISHGIMDLGSAAFGIDPQYIVWLVVENHLKSTESSHGIELNNVEMVKAEISLNAKGSGLDSAFSKFADNTFVTIPPGESRSVQVGLIPPNVAGRMSLGAGRYLETTAKVRLVGERGGTEITTNTIRFPITICNGCLLENIGPCDSATFPETVFTGHTCNKSQDEKVHCCYDSDAAGADNPFRCPAVEDATTEDK